ncbi:MAG: tritrans,polycis-undecaprenyl-diphosphate synthase (GGDP specific) [Candidatus Micrarchaeota archaeon]|nr:MAG: tritrans,polycis-undecaprenyl-diphosphate synthase (GGDP specific) [Candidatus Micrarchaeota archaeon]
MVKRILSKSSSLSYDDINRLITKNLLSSRIGNIDLVFRTSGELRLSGFLPIQTAYSELYFCNKLWPEIEESDLKDAISAYNNRERRFGR